MKKIKTDEEPLQSKGSPLIVPVNDRACADNWDLIIIGGGPAGLTAGIYGARSGLRTLILEMMIPGGCIARAAVVENYPGFPEGISGPDLAERLKAQCINAGTEIHTMEEVKTLDINQKIKHVITNEGTYTCSAIIIATGSTNKQLGVPGESRLQGRGISCCALCDGPLFKNKRVLVAGGGNAAVIDAIYLSNIAMSVKLVHRSSALRAENALVKKLIEKRVEILYNTEIKKFVGDDQLMRVELSNNETSKSMEIDVDGTFVQIGSVPNSGFARKAGLELDEKGYIVVDSGQRTNVDGVFAAGDVTTSLCRQCGTAVGSAIVAAVEAYGYIERPYYRRG